MLTYIKTLSGNNSTNFHYVTFTYAILLKNPQKCHSTILTELQCINHILCSFMIAQKNKLHINPRTDQQTKKFSLMRIHSEWQTVPTRKVECLIEIFNRVNMADVSLACIEGMPNCYNNINISALKCNKSIPGASWKLSQYCYYATDLDSTECFPKNFFTNDTTDYNIQLFASLWILFVGIVGVAGNTLTIVAIPYNMMMKRYILFTKQLHKILFDIYLVVKFWCYNHFH